jgi:predicted Rossmann fold nucleotide-binding protein DprA/Smf involved in DNA uptake
MTLSANTQAILLLTAPLIAGRGERSTELLTLRDYNRLARLLREHQRQPADLLGPDAGEIATLCQSVVETERLRQLLARGFLLGQAVERWQARAIRVLSRADADYPRRLKSRLREDAPPVLYCCGDLALLEAGGLAIVGSRDADQAVLDGTARIAAFAARAGRAVISGGARGVDQAAMHAALDAGGLVTGVLADSLERAALSRDSREPLLDGRLALISPWDPAAGFNVGNAMQRNKLIYALADAALIVSSDYRKGGTWAGAVEQLERLRLVTVYVRDGEPTSQGLQALQAKGALPWPDPATPEALGAALSLHPDLGEEASATEKLPTAKVLLDRMETPRTEAELAADLRVSRSQAREWLRHLVEEGLVVKSTRPVRYQSAAYAGRLL